MRLITGIITAFAGLALTGCGSEGDSLAPAGTSFESGPTSSPRNLRVERIRDGEIWLQWERPAGGSVETYIVYRSSGAEVSTAVDTTYGTSFEDQGLEYETNYSYFVTAISRSGHESERSQVVSGQPFNNLSPFAPVGVQALAHNIAIFEQLEILIDWQANVETDLVGYRVYRSTDAGFEVGPENMIGLSLEPRYVDRLIDVGVVYYYRVTALDRGDKESLSSAPIADVALPEPEPIEPMEGELTSTTPVFRWHPVPDAESYRVVVTTSPTSGEVSAIGVTDLTSATFAGRRDATGDLNSLVPGAIYYWKVIASTRNDGTENSVSPVQQFKIR